MRHAYGAALVAQALVGASTPPSAQVRITPLPAPVESDRRRLIAFEVVGTFDPVRLVRLRSLSIVAPGSKEPVVKYDGAGLDGRVVTDSGARGTTSRVFRVYVEADVPRDVRLRTLEALVTFERGDGSLQVERSPVATVQSAPSVVLGPPLSSGNWVAVHDPSWPRGHRRVVQDTAGRQRIPGRYAIDWVGVGEDGEISTGDPDRPADVVGYGTPVLAGADAMVAAVRDDMQKSLSIKANPPQPLGRGSGNFVVLRVGPSRYTFYEHLRPGSVTVRAGQRVRTGQTIGALGYTGDSTGPHLHMHVADCASPLACEGLPFAIRGMTELGRYSDLDDLGKRRWENTRARGRLGAEWPGYNVVISFPAISKGSNRNRQTALNSPGAFHRLDLLVSKIYLSGCGSQLPFEKPTGMEERACRPLSLLPASWRR